MSTGFYSGIFLQMCYCLITRQTPERVTLWSLFKNDFSTIHPTNTHVMSFRLPSVQRLSRKFLQRTHGVAPGIYTRHRNTPPRYLNVIVVHSAENYRNVRNPFRFLFGSISLSFSLSSSPCRHRVQSPNNGFLIVRHRRPNDRRHEAYYLITKIYEMKFKSHVITTRCNILDIQVVRSKGNFKKKCTKNGKHSDRL